MPETLFSPVGTICVVARPDINISSLPNQRQMRVWHLAGLKRGGVHIFL